MNRRLCYQEHRQASRASNMRRTAIVVGITLTAMFGEIIFGLLTGSMSLLVDGIHMGTHGLALGVTLIAYYISGKHSRNRKFTFSSGKVEVLGGFSNAAFLAITAIIMTVESVERLISPEEVDFTLALGVALIGLLINIASALILSPPWKGDSHGEKDQNLRAAYLHVITDALTSVLAILALLSGRIFSVTWPDAAVAILAAMVILKWAYDLLISSGKILVDFYDGEQELNEVRTILKSKNRKLQDFHIWKTSPAGRAMVLSVIPSPQEQKNSSPQLTAQIRGDIMKEFDLQHLTVEIAGD